MKAAAQVKAEGKKNDLLERLASDPLFKTIHNQLHTLVDPKLFTGCCAEQVDEFLSEVVAPLLKQHVDVLSKETKDKISV